MIIITLDVLAHPAEDLGARQPITEGRQLWNMFFPAYQGRICVLATGVQNSQTQILLEWLKRENYKAGSVDLIDEESPDAKLERVRSIQAGYGRVDWFVDTDTSTITSVIHEGIPSILVSVPSMARPEWHTEKQVRAWDELSRELDRQALIKAEKSWKE